MATDDDGTQNPPANAAEEIASEITTSEELSSATDGLSEDERGLLGIYESRTKEGTDDADDGTDGADAISDEQAQGGDETPDSEGEASGSEEGGEGGEEDDSAPSLVKVGDKEFTPDQLQAAARAYEFVEGLSQDQKEFVAAALTGNYVLVPTDAWAELQGRLEGGTSKPSSDAGGSPDDDEDEEWLDPKAGAKIADLEARIAELQGQTTQLTQREADELRQTQIAQLREADEAFQTQYGLTPQESDELKRRIHQSGTFPALIHSMDGDVKAALSYALENAYWSDPTYRQRAIDDEAARKAEAEEANRARARDQRRKSSALSGSGGSVRRDSPPPNSREGRRAGIVSALKGAMDDGTPS